MSNRQIFSNKFTARESFLMSLINKLVSEYKTIMKVFQQKPFKIVDILSISSIPGDTVFTIQIAQKNVILQISAAEIIQKNYDLNHFNDFHAAMIIKASEGKLIEFLKLSETVPLYKIVGKRFNLIMHQHLFIIEDKDGVRFKKTAEQIANDKQLLSNIGLDDIYDIKFTQGAESILKEKALLLFAKQENEKN